MTEMATGKGKKAGKASKPTTEDDVFTLLDTIQPDAGDGTEAFLVKLSQKVDTEEGARGQALVAANLHRVKIGMELLDELEKGLPKGESMEDFQKRRAKVLGMKARNLRYILSAAREITKARTLAKTLPIRVLARGLTKVPKTVGTFVTTGKLTLQPTQMSQEEKRSKMLTQFKLLAAKASSDEDGVWFFFDVLGQAKTTLRKLGRAIPARTQIRLFAGKYAGMVGKTVGAYDEKRMRYLIRLNKPDGTIAMDRVTLKKLGTGWEVI